MFNLKRIIIRRFIKPEPEDFFPDIDNKDFLRNIKFIGSKYPKLRIGEESYCNGITIYCWDPRIEVSIGKYCSLADNIVIVAGGEHDIDWVSSFPFIDRWQLKDLYHLRKPRWKGNVKIGNDVWIGNQVTLLSGVEIGDGAVIGAGAMVVKNVPPYAIVAGNPAKIIRYRFEPDVIKNILEISWWNWERDLIKERVKDFLEISTFISKYSTKSNQ